MQRVLALVTAELLQFQLLRHRLLVLGRRVVPTLALAALQRDDFSSLARHAFVLRKFVLEPSTRFELVTPSLPRTCSTPELRGRYLRLRGIAVAGSRGEHHHETSSRRYPVTSLWSGRRDSNPRPTAWKAVTLPLSYSR